MADKLDRVTGTDSLRKFFDSPYMGAYSISDGIEPVVTIKEVLQGKITLDGGRKEEHVLLNFAERSVPGMTEVKPLVLNATNQKTLEKLYGKGADALTGKKIQFYIDPAVKAIGGGTTEGVRIRARVPRQTEPGPVKCSDCSAEITEAGGMNAAQVSAYARRRFGADLCAGCMKSREAAKAEPVVAEPANTETTEEAINDPNE